MSLDYIYANIAAARLELGEIRNPPMQVRDALKRLGDALTSAQGMARDSAETEGLRSLRTAKPGPKDAPDDCHRPKGVA